MSRRRAFLGISLRAGSLLVLTLLSWATGCDRPAEPHATSVQQAPAPQPPSRAFHRPGAQRIVAIGDLHGDLTATRHAFRLSGGVDESDQWIGKELVIVQTGDQVDRGDDDAAILQFLHHVAAQATEAGGAVYVLNGNHETMNVLGDFRYVTPAALQGFEHTSPVSPRAVDVPEPFLARARAFLPGGQIALQLSQRPLVLLVGDTLFAHGGVLPSHVKYGLDRLNAETAAWMRGERVTPPAPVVDPDGPLWTRLYGDPELSRHACDVLSKTLALVGARRMVVGHTVQEGGVSSACSERVYRIDVGLSRYYGGRPVQVLEIKGDQVRTLTAH